MSGADIFASIFTGGAGGLIGVIGNISNTLLAMKQKKLEYDYQLAMIPLQLNADIERGKAQLADTVEKGANALMLVSQENDKATGKESTWVLNVRAMIRPTALFLLWAFVVALFYWGALDTDMKSFVIHNVVSDASMALAWFFGSRASDKIMQGYRTKAQ